MVKNKLAYHRHTSLLDNDYYAFTMGQVVHDWVGMRDCNVRYEFINRSKDIQLGRYIPLDMLRDEITAIQELSFSAKEIDFLRSQGMFTERYLDFLANQLKLPEVHVDSWDGQLILAYEGHWDHAIYWETPLLSLVKQLFYVNTLNLPPLAYQAEGERRLNSAIESFNRYRFPIVEMGTRRRFSRTWQLEVLHRLQRSVPTLLGTSNVKLAMDLGLKPLGTMAHQMFVIPGAVSFADGSEGRWALSRAQSDVLDRWEDAYLRHPHMLTMLTDTWTTEFFLDTITPTRANRWRGGMRQDSGNCFDQVEYMIKWMQANDIDPMTHAIVASDDLRPSKMFMLHMMFSPYTSLKYGVGTFLTSNLDVPTPNIVIKPVWADDYPCVKLSDDPRKATGDPEAVAQYRNLVEQRST